MSLYQSEIKNRFATATEYLRDNCRECRKDCARGCGTNLTLVCIERMLVGNLKETEKQIESVALDTLYYLESYCKGICPFRGQDGGGCVNCERGELIAALLKVVQETTRVV
jgi:hypothetical protein